MNIRSMLYLILCNILLMAQNIIIYGAEIGSFDDSTNSSIGYSSDSSEGSAYPDDFVENLVRKKLSSALLNPDGSNYESALQAYEKYIVDLTTRIDFLSTQSSSSSAQTITALQELRSTLEQMHQQSFFDMVKQMNVTGKQLSIEGSIIAIDAGSTPAEVYNAGIQKIDVALKKLKQDNSRFPVSKTTPISLENSKALTAIQKAEPTLLDSSSLGKARLDITTFMNQNFLMGFFDVNFVSKLGPYSMSDRLKILNHINKQIPQLFFSEFNDGMDSELTVSGIRAKILYSYNKIAQPADRIALKNGVFVLASKI